MRGFSSHKGVSSHKGHKSSLASIALPTPPPPPAGSLPKPGTPPKPPPPKITFAPHDVAHAGPRLGVKFFENGLRVALVDPNSPALKAGLSPNDIVQKAGGRAVASHGDFAAAINAAVASGKLRLSVLRDGKIFGATLALTAPTGPPSGPPPPPGSRPPPPPQRPSPPTPPR